MPSPAANGRRTPPAPLVLLTQRPLPFACLLLATAVTATADPVISEFMASNATTLKDGHGNYEDWIEIWNPDPVPVDLAGWRLTDKAADPSRFVFPPLTIPAGGRLVIFASDQPGSTGTLTHVDPAGYLHTNFSLSKNGEYLALLNPDGIPTTEFSPAYPAQTADLSYGTMETSDSLVGPDTQARYIVPTSTDLDTASPDWRSNSYDASGWELAAGSGLGFESGTATAYWPLDESAGSSVAVDATGNGYDGTLSGSATPGAAGHSPTTLNAVGFSGSLGKISVPYSPALNPETFTFAAWVRPQQSTGTYQAIVTSRQDNPGRGYILYITPAGKWEFWTGTGSGWNYCGSPAVEFGEWTHVAIVRRRNGDLRLYLNGVSAASRNGTGFGPNPGNPLHLGAGNQDGSLFRFDGTIDDATLWNHDIGELLIQTHRDNSGGTFPTPAYGGHYQTNVQASLETVNPGLYARHAFTVADPAVLASLQLRMKYDDGFVAYLNGAEVARRNLTGTRAFDSVADSDRSDTAAVVWEELDISSAGLPLIVPGLNTLAIHAMRRSLTHQDFLCNPELNATSTTGASDGYFASATPGQPNSHLTSPGPDITEVSHTPAEPLPGQAVTVTARVRPRFAQAIRSVTLVPRIQYNAESAPIAMTDAGPVEGATDDSRWFTGTIPNAGGAAARQMLRYYLTSSDTSSRTWRSPFITDTSNDDGKSQSPQYHGTVIGDPALAAGMPVLQWFTQDVANSDTRTGCRASVFYQGKFYDNIYVRQRGGYTSAGSQKFNFNRGHGLFVDDTIGTVGEVNMNSAGADSSYLRPLLAFDLWRLSGHEGCFAHIVAMVRNGSFHRMSSMIEQVDEDFLNRYDLDENGALYKFVQRVGETPLPGGDYSNSPALGDTLYGVEKKTRLYENINDLDALVAGLNQTDPAARDAYLFRHLNIPNFVNFMAVRNLTGEGDMNRKNFYLYRDSEHSGEWRIFPWDKDLTFGSYYNESIANPWQASQTYYHDPSGTKQWCVLFEAGLNNPQIRAMVARRIRGLADGILGPIGTATNGSLLEARLETIRSGMLPLPEGRTPPGGYNDRSGIDSWLSTHRNHTYNTYGPSSAYRFVADGPAALPQVDIVDADGFPATGTQQDHEYIRLSNPGDDAVDISGWTLWNPGKIKPFHTFAAGTVIPGGSLAPLHQPYVVRNIPAFRSRPGAAALEFVLGEYGGQLSARGETIELRAGPLAGSRLVSSFTTQSEATPAQRYLRITELMFAPTAPTAAELLVAPGTAAGDYEFIELQNIGTADLDITGARFTDGVDFTFPAMVLAPGQRVLLVANPTAFAARYGSGPTIAGAFGGALDNSGEHLRIEDAAGEMILDFSYDELWFPPADGGGRSLVVRNPLPDYSTYDLPTHWALSGAFGGTPGAADNGDFAHHYDGWLRDHFSENQIYLPEPDYPPATPNSALIGPEADPDGDGLNNFTEYAFGRDPLVPDNHSLTSGGIIDETGRKYLAVTFTRRHKALDLSYTAETSGDLRPPWIPTSQQSGTVTDLGGGLEQITLRDTEPAPPHSRFIRVRVTKP